MHTRKIQLIAGTTYTISLPKDWITKNDLREKDDLNIYENDDRTLLITSRDKAKQVSDSISINIDKYVENVDHILFSLYYMGIENITLFSKDELTKTTRLRIRKSLTYMSGTEISYEDTKKITIKVLLDRSKVNLFQILYRINLILRSSITNFITTIDYEELRLNENEIDRLYHLITKTISISLVDSAVLKTSGIKNLSLIPSLVLLGKRLENIGDNLYQMALYSKNSGKGIRVKDIIFEFMKENLNTSLNHLLKKSSEMYTKCDENKYKNIYLHIDNISDRTVQNYVEDVIRYLRDIEDEIVNISLLKGVLS